MRKAFLGLLSAAFIGLALAPVHAESKKQSSSKGHMKLEKSNKDDQSLDKKDKKKKKGKKKRSHGQSKGYQS